MNGRQTLIPMGLPEKAAAREIMDCNAVTSRHGLALTQAEAAMLSAARCKALIQSGRTEFGGGAMRALITAFCDSPYIVRVQYADTLCELARIFYDFKTDSLDEVDDAEAFAAMRTVFDEWRGSLDMVESRMEAYARNVRFGRDMQDSGEDIGGEDEEKGEEYE